MGKLRAAVKADKWAAEDLEVNDYFIALRVARSIGWCDPIICNLAVWKDAGVEVSGFASFAVEPEAGNQFHL